MKTHVIFKSILLPVVFLFLIASAIASEALPSWNDTTAKEKIVKFVKDATDSHSPFYIKPAERIAVVDNDGTLQVEKPYAFVDMFALVRTRDLAVNNPEHLTQKYPDWKKDQLIVQLAETPVDKLPEMLEKMKYDDLIKLFNLANTSDSQEEINSALNEYVYHYKHIRFNKPPAELLYKPMVELVEYLKESGFSIYFASGSTTDYLRQFSENIGIPKESIIGWNFNGEVRKDKDGRLFVYKTGPTVEPMSNKEGKVVDIARQIGKKPVVAIGNSSGDIAMLTYTRQNNPEALCMVVEHTDAVREYKYDFGAAVRDAAKEQNWIVIDMQKDFEIIF